QSHFGMLFQVFADIVLALPDASAAIAEPRARLVDDTGFNAQVNDFALAGNTRAVHDVEFGLLERWRNLVLDHFDPGFVADDFVTLLDGANAANVQAYRGIEFERIAAGRGFRIAEHHADLHADLVDENDHA